MTEIILQQLSIHAYILTILALVYRIRQAHIHKGVAGWLLRIALSSLALACLQKLFQRIDGDLATMEDVWREMSLLVVLLCRIQIRHLNPFVQLPSDPK